MNNDWLNSQIKDQYESGELIVLVLGDKGGELSKGKFFLVPESSGQKIELFKKYSAENNQSFIEFYTLNPGRYKLVSSIGNKRFEVIPKSNLNFQTEFGIFFTVVAILVMIMAIRYLGLFRSKGRS